MARRHGYNLKIGLIRKQDFTGMEDDGSVYAFARDSVFYAYQPRIIAPLIEVATSAESDIHINIYFVSRNDIQDTVQDILLETEVCQVKKFFNISRVLGNPICIRDCIRQFNLQKQTISV